MSILNIDIDNTSKEVADNIERIKSMCNTAITNMNNYMNNWAQTKPTNTIIKNFNCDEIQKLIYDFTISITYKLNGAGARSHLDLGMDPSTGVTTRYFSWRLKSDDIKNYHNKTLLIYDDVLKYINDNFYNIVTSNLSKYSIGEYLSRHLIEIDHISMTYIQTKCYE